MDRSYGSRLIMTGERFPSCFEFFEFYFCANMALFSKMAFYEVFCQFTLKLKNFFRHLLQVIFCYFFAKNNFAIFKLT